jgi:heterotetrameric sarcosine oxidase gamma subunit
MPDALTFAPLSAYAGLLKPVGPAAAGVVVQDRVDLQIATVIARGDRAALAARIGAAYGVDLPIGLKRVEAGAIAFVGTGPRTWLATRDGLGDLSADLRQALGDAAAVSDHSDGYAVLRVSGPQARATFEKGIGIELHPRAFRPGDAAATTCAHLGIVLWQLDEAPAYEVAVFRSLAGSFWHWLSESAAEFGLTTSLGCGARIGLMAPKAGLP